MFEACCDDVTTGTSYLEVARVLIDHGAHTGADLRELWSRIVFNMLVSNSSLYPNTVFVSLTTQISTSPKFALPGIAATAQVPSWRR